ncbi:MAG: signal recognition particle subunit [Chaenotheca gracillima]|nr:MAG: signal recognition particle subunit [Chaenotheca gracillima]
MSRQAQVEELSDSSDSDPMEMDPSEFDPTQFANSLMQPTQAPANPSLMKPSSIPAQQTQQTKFENAPDPEKYKRYQCLYPVYFDKTRSRAEGRRVGKEQAVENPLAREIVESIQLLGLKALFEPGKLHPKDWSNPGRIKVLVKEDGKPVNPRVKNKHHLYNLVSSYLKAHPTTQELALKMRIPNMPPPDPKNPLPPPAVPRGWKMGTILPLHSPALSGGGVSENFLKEMMAEMQGQGQIEGGTGSGEGGKKKKDKKKGKS